jgi:hypothetical protein
MEISCEEVADLAASVGPRLKHLPYDALMDLTFAELDGLQRTLAEVRRGLRLLDASFPGGSSGAKAK